MEHNGSGGHMHTAHTARTASGQERVLPACYPTRTPLTFNIRAANVHKAADVTSGEAKAAGNVQHLDGLQGKWSRAVASGHLNRHGTDQRQLARCQRWHKLSCSRCGQLEARARCTTTPSNCQRLRNSAHRLALVHNQGCAGGRMRVAQHRSGVDLQQGGEPLVPTAGITWHRAGRAGTPHWHLMHKIAQCMHDQGHGATAASLPSLTIREASVVEPADRPPGRLLAPVTLKVPRDDSAWVAVIMRAVMTSGSRPPTMVVGPTMLTLAGLAELPQLVSPRLVSPVTPRVPLEASALVAVMRRAVMLSAVRARMLALLLTVRVFRLRRDSRAACS